VVDNITNQKELT